MSTEDEDIKTYVEMMRSLCPGMGIRGNLYLITPEVLKDFGCESRGEFVDLIDSTLSDLISVTTPETIACAQLLAAQCALSLDDGDELNLTGRREQIMPDLDVSYRTIIRYEIAGMEILLRSLGFGIGDESAPVELEVPKGGLLQRIKRLESILEALLEAQGITVPE